jgi:hypothetical protein
MSSSQYNSMSEMPGPLSYLPPQFPSPYGHPSQYNMHSASQYNMMQTSQYRMQYPPQPSPMYPYPGPSPYVMHPLSPSFYGTYPSPGYAPPAGMMTYSPHGMYSAPSYYAVPYARASAARYSTDSIGPVDIIEATASPTGGVARDTTQVGRIDAQSLSFLSQIPYFDRHQLLVPPLDITPTILLHNLHMNLVIILVQMEIMEMMEMALQGLTR